MGFAAIAHHLAKALEVRDSRREVGNHDPTIRRLCVLHQSTSANALAAQAGVAGPQQLDQDPDWQQLLWP